VIALEAKLDPPEVVEGPNEQPGTEEEHGRETDLHGDEQLANAEMAPAPGDRAGLLAKRVSGPGS